LLAACSVKASNIALNVDVCGVITPNRIWNVIYEYFMEFSQQKVGALDVVTSIKCSYSFRQTAFSNCDFSYVKNITFSLLSLYYLPAMLFTTFPRLQSLEFEETDLTEIWPNTFQNATSLYSITL
jgi:hypothetical protein